jgi:hypothetical protein
MYATQSVHQDARAGLAILSSVDTTCTSLFNVLASVGKKLNDTCAPLSHIVNVTLSVLGSPIDSKGISVGTGGTGGTGGVLPQSPQLHRCSSA